MSQARYATLYERLVANTREAGGCWVWTGGVGTNHRPQISIRRNGKHCTCNAAREMLNLFYVLDVPGLPAWEASHLCTDSYLCINPDHLVPETKAQNMARRWGKPVPPGFAWAERADSPTSFDFAIDGSGNNRAKCSGLLLTAAAIARKVQSSQHANGMTT